ncbi:MAG: fibronectin type III domain-containing protein, partial [Verrucomicrobiales bacterium]
YSNKANSRSEKDLLRNYLNKDHNFRHRVFTVERRGLVCDNFGERNGEAFASSGWRNFAPMFGAQNNKAVPGWQYFPTVSSQGYLWSYGTGGGSFYTCNGVGGSDDFATTEIKSVFTMFLGSYFGDWDNESNFLRATLGSGYALTASWSGRPHWFYHHMALGEPISHSTVLSQNNSSFYENKLNTANRQVHQALLGDPTLRMHPVIPASNLRGSVSGGSIRLDWNASGDSDLQGYHVYRGNSASGPFTRLTSSPIGGTSYTDSAYSSSYIYMVRAVKLERSGSGSYYNASQGIFYPSSGGGGSTGGTTGSTTGSTTGTTTGGSTPQTPSVPTSGVATSVSSSQINVTWVDASSNETGFRVERKTGPNGSWLQVATLGSNATSYNNTGLSPGTLYYYRVFAFNDAGNSAPSAEFRVATLLANATPAAATFLTADSVTKGNWKGVYGKDGFQIVADGAAMPGYANAFPQGQQSYQWSDTSSDIRALQRNAVSARVAACWFSTSTFTIDVNLIDGNNHRLSLYFLDWDRSGRAQTVEILDAASGAVLNSQTVTGFGDGKYLTWEVKGSIRIRLTKTSGFNAVAMGMFFDPITDAINNNSGTVGELVNGKFHLQIKGNAGKKFDVYSSGDLKTWSKVSTVTLTSSTYDFVDATQQGTSPLRFYRAVAVP